MLDAQRRQRHANDYTGAPMSAGVVAACLGQAKALRKQRRAHLAGKHPELMKKPASETPWTKKFWIYDLHTNQHFTLKANPLKREDLDEFVQLYNPANRLDRAPTWSAENPEGRWRGYEVAELMARDKASLDIFWLRDETLADSDNLPPPDVIAQEIVDDLEAALEQFRLIAADLSSEGGAA